MGGGESVALEFSVSVRVAVCEGMGQCKHTHTHCTTAALPYFTFPNHSYLTHAYFNKPLLSEWNRFVESTRMDLLCDIKTKHRQGFTAVISCSDRKNVLNYASILTAQGKREGGCGLRSVQ